MSAMAIVDDDRAVESPEAGFDFAAEIDALRVHSTKELRKIVKDERRVQQRSKLRELGALRLLDEREELVQVRDAGTDARSTKADVATARALETQPKIAAAAHAGDLSLDQVRPLVQLATPETDGEWARRARDLAPADLQRMVRRRRTVTGAEAADRRAARSLTTWRDDAQGMHGGRYWLPDLDGVLVDKVLDHMAERMRPPKGGTWDTLAHRKADALVELCRSYADVQPTGRFRFEIVNILDPNAKSFGAEVAGIALAPEQLTALVPTAKVRDCVVDETGLAKTVGKPRRALPADVERHVRRRDSVCRTEGCANPADEIHHTNPVSQFGETTDVHELAGVCKQCHRMLVPNGPYWLVGDPEQPGDLHLSHRSEMPRDGPSP